MYRRAGPRRGDGMSVTDTVAGVVAAAATFLKDTRSAGSLDGSAEDIGLTALRGILVAASLRRRGLASDMIRPDQP